MWSFIAILIFESSYFLFNLRSECDNMKRPFFNNNFICLFTMILAAFSACINPQFEAETLLMQAEQLMENQPDSALLLIDSIFYPEESLKKADYMQYLVARVRANYKNYRSIAEDTLVFAARDYFTNHNRNGERTSLAWFYSGCVYREQGNLKDAMQHYKEAEKYAGQTNNMDLNGLVQYNIGDLLTELGLYTQALEAYKKAENFYRQLPENSEGRQARGLAAMGRMYLLKGNEDSAFLSFHKGLDLAILARDSGFQSVLAQNLSVAYKETGAYDKAEEYLRQAFALESNTTESYHIYLNFAKLYSQTDQEDSVKVYVDKLKKVITSSEDLYFKASAYAYLAEVEKENRNHNEAFDYLQKRNSTVEKIMEKRSEQSVLEIQQKYDYEIVRNRYMQMTNQYQRWGILLLAILLTSGTIATLHIIRQKNILLKTRENIDTLRQMAAGLVKSHETEISQKESDFRKLLLWKFDVIKKSALLSTGEDDHNNNSHLVKKFQAIVYNKNATDQWENIESVFNQVNQNISQNIKHRFPQLNETEYRICLLSYAKMSVKEIAVILQISPNTVQTYRTGLRKKLGITNPATDIPLFLRTIVDE